MYKFIPNPLKVTKFFDGSTSIFVLLSEKLLILPYTLELFKK